jgi:hypothetical protein
MNIQQMNTAEVCAAIIDLQDTIGAVGRTAYRKTGANTWEREDVTGTGLRRTAIRGVVSKRGLRHLLNTTTTNHALEIISAPHLDGWTAMFRHRYFIIVRYNGPLPVFHEGV